MVPPFAWTRSGNCRLELQAKLLRVIQHNEFERLGSSQTIKVDVRIVATTNRNLEEEIRKGRFRQDLYYRLNVFPHHGPSIAAAERRYPFVGPGLRRAICQENGETDHVDPEGDDEGPAGLPVARERPGAGKHH